MSAFNHISLLKYTSDTMFFFIIPCIPSYMRLFGFLGHINVPLQLTIQKTQVLLLYLHMSVWLSWLCYDSSDPIYPSQLSSLSHVIWQSGTDLRADSIFLCNLFKAADQL